MAVLYPFVDGLGAASSFTETATCKNKPGYPVLTIGENGVGLKLIRASPQFPGVKEVVRLLIGKVLKLR